jgi:hypothetical protein
MRRSGWVRALCSSALWLSGCGGAPQATLAANDPSTLPGAVAAGGAVPVAAASIAAPPREAPPTPAEPTLGIEDVIVGTGDAAAAGDRVSVHYTGTLADGTEFDSSRKRNRPFEFALGVGQVIKGWDQGVVGMKVGGRRKLTIPSPLGYGARGQPPIIPADATLLFDVELVALEHGSAKNAGQPRMISARHILIQYMGSRSAEASIVRTREQARSVSEEVLRRLKSGEDFARLAVEFSDEPGAGSRGGALGRFGHGKWVPEFDTAAFALKPGEISGIVETPFGFHVIQRLE